MTSLASSERSRYGVSIEKPYVSESATSSACVKDLASPLEAQPDTAIAPSFSDLDLSGIIRSGSSFLSQPIPVQAGHAPDGLLKENDRGSISSIEILQ